MESGGPKHYAEVSYLPEDYLVFGRETAGLPKALLEGNGDRWLRIPMFNAASRSLNLSNCVALVLFEALRQQGLFVRDALVLINREQGAAQRLREAGVRLHPVLALEVMLTYLHEQGRLPSADYERAIAYLSREGDARSEFD